MARLGVLIAVAALAGCSEPHDAYDVSKTDLKPAAAAAVSTVRHTEAFASGASLGMGAELKPLDPSPVEEVRLDTTHKIIEIAPGVRFSAWTFGDQVPGPTIRARVGDKIRFSMTNRSDEPAPPMILEHIASGMYGALIVEPRAGYPTRVDREYVIVQSEFYAKPGAGGRRAGGGPVYVLDGERGGQPYSSAHDELTRNG